MNKALLIGSVLSVASGFGLLLLGKGDEAVAISLIVGGVALLVPSPVQKKAK